MENGRPVLTHIRCCRWASSSNRVNYGSSRRDVKSRLSEPARSGFQKVRLPLLPAPEGEDAITGAAWWKTCSRTVLHPVDKRRAARCLCFDAILSPLSAKKLYSA
ncbi:hypothetical protein K0M31_015639 [Melipona bicolor]|uniref:Uncharacterized protein n=1 Tax=Melipona bicolor TaxID=60889 RepID=A0AA40FEW3_9HYME|nr:hypothetical protein K0M31_015639 [Melipona bicolor]